MSWGLRPQAMIGHSIGEYVAACLAGVFTLEEGLRLVAARGRLIWDLPKGMMLGVNLPEQEVRPLINGSLAVAAVNAPSLCVISGPSEHFPELTRKLEAQGLFGREFPDLSRISFRNDDAHTGTVCPASRHDQFEGAAYPIYIERNWDLDHCYGSNGPELLD